LLYLYCGLCICIGAIYLYRPDVFVSVMYLYEYDECL